jgi:hypothetical protein
MPTSRARIDYRQQAEELRRIAEATGDAKAKADLLRLAAKYLQMANRRAGEGEGDGEATPKCERCDASSLISDPNSRLQPASRLNDRRR